MPHRDRATARLPDRIVVRRLRTLATALILLLIGLGVGLALRRGGGAAPPARIVSVYGYSALDEVLQAGILPAFRRLWMERASAGVEFVSTFAGSGALTERILRQVPAQVVFLASELDAHLLEARGAIDPAARSRLPRGGVYARTPLAILVRPGNPKQIRNFADLARPGVAVVLADPASSGSAQWAILAAYGAALRGGGDAAAAAGELRALRRNSAGPAASAREARIAFASGIGDALLTYEQELVPNPLHAGALGEIVLPAATILCEPVVALVERNVAPRDRELVSALVNYLFDEEAQRILEDYGFRPAAGPPGAATAGRAEVADPFTLADLGGAERARREILQQTWDRLAAESSP